MSQSLSGGGASGGSGSGGSAGPSQLAALHYESLAQAAASTGSSLWSQLREKFPEIRNATQYYATEAHRYGANLIEEAQKQQQLLQGGGAGGLSREGSSSNTGTLNVTNTTTGGNELPVSGGDGSRRDPSLTSPSAEGLLPLSEVHYQPNPIGTLGLTVRSTDVVTLPGTGETILCMCIDQGFACFEVTPTAVFEIAVDLGVAMNPMSRVASTNPSSRFAGGGGGKSSTNRASSSSGSGGVVLIHTHPSGGPNSYVIDVQPLSLDTFILLTSTGWLLALHIGGSTPGPGGIAAGSMNAPPSADSFVDDLTCTTGGGGGGASSSNGGPLHLVGYCQVNTASPKALKLMRGSRGAHAAVSSTEFAQITVYSIATCFGGNNSSNNPQQQQQQQQSQQVGLDSRGSSPYPESLATDRSTGSGNGGGASGAAGGVLEVVFKECASLCGETTVFATSGNWLAYSGQADAAKTVFVNTKTESNLESVANMALNGLTALKNHGLGAMWGTSPSMGPQAIPLGTVVIHSIGSPTSAAAAAGGVTGGSFTGTSNGVAESQQAANVDFASFSAHNHPIQTMKWDATGTLLATASTVGTSVNVFQVMPISNHGSSSSSSGGVASSAGGGGEPLKPKPASGSPDASSAPASAEVALVYRLTRGVTQNTIVDISFGGYNSWIAVCSATGTCHFYKVPRDDQMQHGKKAAAHPARSLTAVCRARSAPSATPVSPRFVFTPSVLSVGGSLHGVEGCLVTQSGTVNWLTCTEDGATLGYTKSIDAFSGDKEKVVQASLAHFSSLEEVSSSDRKRPSTNDANGKPRVSPFISGCGVVADAYFNNNNNSTNRNSGPASMETPGSAETDFAAYDAQWRAQIELSTHDAAYMDKPAAPSTPVVLPSSAGAAGGGYGAIAAKVTGSAQQAAAGGTMSAASKVAVKHVDPQQVDDEWDDC